MKHKIITVLGHLAGILFFLSTPIVFAPDQRIGLASQREIFGYLLMIGFFYLNFYVLIPKFYFKKKYVWFILIILACYIFITFLPQYIFPFADHLGPGWNRSQALDPEECQAHFHLVARQALPVRNCSGTWDIRCFYFSWWFLSLLP
jgi:hypothetical protein